MPLFLQHTASDHRLGIWHITESPDELLFRLPRREHYEAASLRFSAPQRRAEWLAVRLLLHTLLGEEKEIAYHPDGKPYLVDNSHSISISHTRGYAAIHLGDPAREVGIDIEQYGERVHRVAHKFIRPDEHLTSYLGTTTWSLLLHWSAKETLFKCIPTDAIDFIDHLHILPFQPSEEGTLEAREYKTTHQRHYTIHYLLRPDFVLTYAVSE